jgi:pimeloyl-ACP methyl ester carboxylesterase
MSAMTPEPRPEPARACLDLGGRLLSYLDFGGPGPALVALHGHFGEGRTFTALAERLAPRWRVIAPDQRGHGRSDRPADFSREGYLADLEALLDHLALGPVVLLGHSLGGLNAYQFAARNPDRVRALVIEDIGAEIGDDLSFCLGWPRRAPTRATLLEQLADSARYLTDAVREHPDGWGLAFRPEDMVASHAAVRGDHWSDWLATDCPALLLHGRRSDALDARQAEAMAARRPRTRLVTLDTGHTVHESDPTGFAEAVDRFLGTLGEAA